MKLVFRILLKKLEFTITFFTWQKSWVCVFEKLAACFVRTPGSVPFCHFFLHLIFHYFSCTVILTFILFPVVYGQIGAFVWKGALLGQWESCLLVCQSLPYHPSSLCIHSLTLQVARAIPCQLLFSDCFVKLSIAVCLCVLLGLDLPNALFFSFCASHAEVLMLIRS